MFLSISFLTDGQTSFCPFSWADLTSLSDTVEEVPVVFGEVSHEAVERVALDQVRRGVHREGPARTHRRVATCNLCVRLL